MIRMRSIEEMNEKRIRRSVQAYMEGEQNLKWILGVIGPDRPLASQLLVNQFARYSNTSRYHELRASLLA